MLKRRIGRACTDCSTAPSDDFRKAAPRGSECEASGYTSAPCVLQAQRGVAPRQPGNPSPNRNPLRRALESARRVLEIEASAVAALGARLDERFAQAVEMILACRGRAVVSGIGKSGHVAHKIASTLASTGTPAFFLHPAEAIHGDLGMITAQDVLIALSNSGESAEVLAIIPQVKRRGAKLIAMTGNPGSTLAHEADVHLDAGVAIEACPLGLAPTASTTAALALGDALAIALLDARGFGPEDFAQSHPGGALGRRLLTHVADIMRRGDAVPSVTHGASLWEALLEISRKGMGMTAIVDARCARNRNLHRRRFAAPTGAPSRSAHHSSRKSYVQGSANHTPGAPGSGSGCAHGGTSHQSDHRSRREPSTGRGPEYARPVSSQSDLTHEADETLLTPELRERARSVRLLVLDVDGVLTDGTLYFSSAGEEIKAFNIQDGLGIKLLQASGVTVAIITGRQSRALELRAREPGRASPLSGGRG